MRKLLTSSLAHGDETGEEVLARMAQQKKHLMEQKRSRGRQARVSSFMLIFLHLLIMVCSSFLPALQSVKQERRVTQTVLGKSFIFLSTHLGLVELAQMRAMVKIMQSESKNGAARR
jgi:hypothetical protein